MAKTASKEKKERGRLWQRAATRSAILAAARRLIGRAGVGNLSLTAVAREADFAPTTVFAYFANKNDLFLSVLADDLATFARTMQRAGDLEDRSGAASDSSPAQLPAPAMPESLAAPAAAASRLHLVEKPDAEVDAFAVGSDELASQTAIATDLMRELSQAAQQWHRDEGIDAFALDEGELATQEEVASQLLEELAPPAAHPNADADIDAFAVAAGELAAQEDVAADLLRELSIPVAGGDVGREHAVEPADANAAFAQDLVRLQQAVAKLETRPVDQWLERRLREFERGLTALEARPEKAEAATALALMDQTLRSLNARVDTIERRQVQAADDVSRTMAERGEQIDKRLRDFLSDIDAANARTVKRLDALENAAFAAAPEFFQAGIHNVSPRLPAVDSVKPTAQEPEKEIVPEVVEGPAAAVDPQKSFLSTARRSALASAEQNEKKPPPGLRPNRLSKRTLYLIATGLGLAVALIWTGVFFRALAVPSPQHASVHPPAVEKAQKIALKSNPQSELVALAKNGNPKAQLVVALDLLNGPRKNEAGAAQWLTMAARRGDAIAAFKLATLYRSGHGVPADRTQAFRWFEVAARKGNCKAMQDLAVAFAEGWGTDKNESEAARWFTRAASFGLTDAEFNLGVLYEQGLGVPQSLSDAYKWYLVAAGAGDREAEARVDAIKPQLLSTDLAAAEEAAASFKAAAPDPDENVAPALSPFSAG